MNQALFVGIRFSILDLLLTSITMPDPQTSDMRQIPYGLP